MPSSPLNGESCMCCSPCATWCAVGVPCTVGFRHLASGRLSLQGVFKGETASDQERYEIIPPEPGDIGHLGDGRAVLVPRHSPADRSGRSPAKIGRLVAPGSPTSRYGTGLGIALREEQHVVCRGRRAPRAGWPGRNSGHHPAVGVLSPARKRLRASCEGHTGPSSGIVESSTKLWVHSRPRRGGRPGSRREPDGKPQEGAPDARRNRGQPAHPSPGCRSPWRPCTSARS